MNVSSNKVGRVTLIPNTAKWGHDLLMVHAATPLPQIIFDKVMILLYAPRNLDRRLGTNATILYQGSYAFDGSPFQGSVVLNETLSNVTPGIYRVGVASVHDSKYGLTVYESNTVIVPISETWPGVNTLVSTFAITAVLLALAVIAYFVFRRRKGFQKGLVKSFLANLISY